MAAKLLSCYLVFYPEEEMKKRESVLRRAAAMLVALLVLGGVGMTVSGCNTTAGAGQDLSATGHAVTHSAEKVKSGF